MGSWASKALPVWSNLTKKSMQHELPNVVNAGHNRKAPEHPAHHSRPRPLISQIPI